MADMEWLDEIERNLKCGEYCDAEVDQVITAVRLAEIGWTQTLADHAGATSMLDGRSYTSHRAANDASRSQLARFRSGEEKL